MTALLIDAGNTRLKWGVLRDGEVHETGHILQVELADRGIGCLVSRLPRNVDTVLVSNVAGQRFATRLAGVLSAHCGCDVRFARTEARACGLTNAYHDARLMGVDRWVAMIGAWRQLQCDVLVVDAGTAVTIDAVTKEGQHLGGQILPGLALMAGALGTSTSDIPEVRPGEWSAPDGMGIFGCSTEAAVTSGAVNAIVGAVDRAVRVLRSNNYEPITVLTGGNASAMLHALADEPLYRPNLVLAGLVEFLDHTS